MYTGAHQVGMKLHHDLLVNGDGSLKYILFSIRKSNIWISFLENRLCSKNSYCILTVDSEHQVGPS